MEPFTPPYPTPHRTKLSRGMRMIFSMRSWIHTLYARSYHMKMGEVRLPGFNFFIANDLPLVNRIMDNPLQFPKHTLLHEVLEPLIGDSVFSINGEDWANARAMVNSAFAHTHLRTVFPNMDAAAQDMIARIEQRDLGVPLAIDPIMTHITADIILRTILSQSLSEEESQRLFAAFERYQKYSPASMVMRSYGLPNGWLRRKLFKEAAIIHAVFDPIIRARHADFHAGREGPDDILKALMEARHPKTGAPFTHRELIDQVAIIFLAGHETSASALTWALYLIASCPHTQKALHAEATAQELTADSLRTLEQTRNVFRETLRLYPPVSFLMREVKQPTHMRDKTIDPGALLVVSPWLVQRNEANFPCPHAFMPERFDDPAQKEACREAYLPFGKGPRICIGAGFAQQEAVLILARILQKFALSVPAGMVPEPVSRLTLRPRKGVQLLLTPR